MNVRMSAQKMREVVRQIQGLNALQAQALLAVVPRKSARFVAKTLSSGPAVLVGLPEPNPSNEGRPLFNTAVLLKNGEVGDRFRKSLLPTYDVFDEWRYFDPAVEVKPIDWRGHRLGVSICEDIWNDPDFIPHPLYPADPPGELVRAGATVLVNIASSPFTLPKREFRARMIRGVALTSATGAAYERFARVSPQAAPALVTQAAKAS